MILKGPKGSIFDHRNEDIVTKCIRKIIARIPKSNSSGIIK
jgi:hypothetical protein